MLGDLVLTYNKINLFSSDNTIQLSAFLQLRYAYVPRHQIYEHACTLQLPFLNHSGNGIGFPL